MKVILFIFLVGFVYGLFQAINSDVNNGMERQKQLENELEIINNKKFQCEEEIAMLENIIDKGQTIAYQLEKELESCNDIKRQQVILSKLITLDKQTYKDKQRINKLKEEL